MEGAAGPPTQQPQPHPSLAPLSFFHRPLQLRRGDPLLPPPLQVTTVWRGRAQPVISYTRRTWKAASGEPMHAESGYWRPRPDGFVEVVIAQSTGLAEVQKGSYHAEKKTVTLQSELVGNASKVKQITRAFQVVDGELSYIVQMATVTTQLQPHLKALKKI